MFSPLRFCALRGLIKARQFTAKVESIQAVYLKDAPYAVT